MRMDPFIYIYILYRHRSLCIDCTPPIAANIVENATDSPSGRTQITVSREAVFNLSSLPRQRHARMEPNHPATLCTHILFLYIST